MHTRRACGPAFCQLSGEDHTALAFLAVGGDGCISVTANVAPRLCSEMHAAWQEGRVAEAMAIQDRLLPLHDALFAETSPAPVKYAASLLGKTADHCRLPLAPVCRGDAGEGARGDDRGGAAERMGPDRPRMIGFPTRARAASRAAPDR